MPDAPDMIWRAVQAAMYATEGMGNASYPRDGGQG
jgi:hypothetical protein